jgi:cytochrome c-type biogenesis protein CcmH/NrfG
MYRQPLLALILLVFGLASSPVIADGGSYSNSNSRLAPFQELIENEQYEQSIARLEEALRDDPDDADLLNLMAFSNRKLGKFDVALGFYQKALKIEPNYLQLGQPEEAEKRLAVLDKACFFGCREYDELKQAIAEYRMKNPS